MRKIFFSLLLAAALAVPLLRIAADPKEIPNRFIDAPGFEQDVGASLNLRAARRIMPDTFAKMMNDPDTVVLDARSLEKFSQMHIKGSRHLDFTEFTADTLAAVIPSKNTKILIYCNNNIENEERAFPTKAFRAALNLSTFASLYSYGYKNVYELGPVIDPASSAIPFEGTLAPATRRDPVRR